MGVLITICYDDHREAKEEAIDFILDTLMDEITIVNYFEGETSFFINYDVSENFYNNEEEKNRILSEYADNVDKSIEKTEFEYIESACIDEEDNVLIFQYKETEEEEDE